MTPRLFSMKDKTFFDTNIDIEQNFDKNKYVALSYLLELKIRIKYKDRNTKN